MEINRPETRHERNERRERYFRLAEEADTSAIKFEAVGLREQYAEIAKLWRHLAVQLGSRS